jgi:hypothetical protein
VEIETRGRTANETLVYNYIFEKLNRIEEECIFKKEWDFDFGARETPDGYCFAIEVEYRGDPNYRLSTSAKSVVFFVIANDENIEAVTSKIEQVMTEFSPKPEILVVIRADRPQVDTWTLVSGEYRHITQDHGEIEIDALGGDYHFRFDDAYQDVDSIYEQVAA